jgi:hypothetical protein
MKGQTQSQWAFLNHQDRVFENHKLQPIPLKGMKYHQNVSLYNVQCK